MKCLTVQQPWAWSIFHGKGVENRTQLFKYRGPLVIHAGLVDSPVGWASPLVREAHVAAGRPMSGLVHGAAIGLVDLVDCHHAAGCCGPWGEQGYVRRHDGGVGRRITHLVLANPRPFAPVYCKGQLGLWDAPLCVMERVQALGLA